MLLVRRLGLLLPVLLFAFLVAAPGNCPGGDPDPSPSPTATVTGSTPTPTATEPPSPSPSLTPTPDPAPPAGRCRSQDDCPNTFESCFPPGTFIGCGAAPMRECFGDQDCLDPAHICQQNLRPAEDCSWETRCQAPCQIDADCGTNLSCRPDGHCEETTCGDGRSCTAPAYCADPAHAYCTRDNCAADADCGAGNRCVNGGCWEDFGDCLAPPP